MKIIDESKARLLLLLLMGIQCAGVICLSYFRLYGFHGSGDSAMFQQLYFSMQHSGIPESTIAAPPYQPMNWLAWHFSPILYLLLPLVMLFPQPETLNILQAIAIASAAVPIFFSLRMIGMSALASLSIAALYLFNPFTLSASIWDFHEIALAVPLTAAASWAILSYRKYWLVAICLLLLLTKEHYGASVAAIGIWWMIRYRDWRFGGGLAVFGLISLWLILGVIMPSMGDGELSSLLRYREHSDGVEVARYAWITRPDQFSSVIKSLLLSGDGVLFYLLALLLLWMFMPVLMPLALAPAAADLAANLLSLNAMPRTLNGYHSAPIIPVLAIAAGLALKKYGTPVQQWKIPLYSAVMTGFVLLLYPPGTAAWEITHMPLRVEASDVAAIRELVGDRPVSAQSNLSGFFARRKEIQLFPRNSDRVELFIFHLYHPFQRADKNPYNAIYVSDNAMAHFSAVAKQLEDPQLGIRYWKNHWLVLERGAKDMNGTVREEAERRARELGVNPLPGGS